MVESARFQPRWASAPSETISDSLHRRKLSVLAFAKRMESSLEAVNRLLGGEVAIDQEIAERLHRAIGGSARFWLNRETQYQDDVRRLDIERDSKAAKGWVRELPVRDMTKFHWIQPTNDKFEQATECLRFFNVSSVASWRQNYKAVEDVVAFRTSGAFESRPGSVAAWLRRGEIETAGIECQPWDPEKFLGKLQAVRALTRKKDPTVFVPELQRLCAECGVAVAIVRAPTGCRASGATRFTSPTKALLLLSFRYRSDDHFWFTFFHEAGHLLLHDSNALFVEGKGMLLTHEEEEANEFSANTLVPPEYQDEMLNMGQSYRMVMRFARRIGVSPGIIVGQLQHRGRLTRKQMNFLKRRFAWLHD